MWPMVTSDSWDRLKIGVGYAGLEGPLQVVLSAQLRPLLSIVSGSWGVHGPGKGEPWRGGGTVGFPRILDRESWVGAVHVLLQGKHHPLPLPPKSTAIIHLSEAHTSLVHSQFWGC